MSRHIYSLMLWAGTYLSASHVNPSVLEVSRTQRLLP